MSKKQLTLFCDRRLAHQDQQKKCSWWCNSMHLLHQSTFQRIGNGDRTQRNQTNTSRSLLSIPGTPVVTTICTPCRKKCHMLNLGTSNPPNPTAALLQFSLEGNLRARKAVHPLTPAVILGAVGRSEVGYFFGSSWLCSDHTKKGCGSGQDNLPSPQSFSTRLVRAKLVASEEAVASLWPYWERLQEHVLLPTVTVILGENGQSKVNRFERSARLCSVHTRSCGDVIAENDAKNDGGDVIASYNYFCVGRMAVDQHALLCGWLQPWIWILDFLQAIYTIYIACCKSHYLS